MTGHVQFRSQWPVAAAIVGMLVIGLGLPLAAGASPSHQTSGTATVATTGTPVGTMTSTPVGTGTVSPTSTGIPTLASPILVSRFTAHRSGATVLFRWTMIVQDGITGFKIYAGSRALVKHLLRTHHSLSYHYRLRWSGHGPYSLLLLPEYGKAIRVHTTR